MGYRNAAASKDTWMMIVVLLNKRDGWGWSYFRWIMDINRHWRWSWLLTCKEGWGCDEKFFICNLIASAIVNNQSIKNSNRAEDNIQP